MVNRNVWPLCIGGKRYFGLTFFLLNSDILFKMLCFFKRLVNCQFCVHNALSWHKSNLIILNSLLDTTHYQTTTHCIQFFWATSHFQSMKLPKVSQVFFLNAEFSLQTGNTSNFQCKALWNFNCFIVTSFLSINERLTEISRRSFHVEKNICLVFFESETNRRF